MGVGIRHLVSSDQHSVLATSDLWLISISVAISLISQAILHLISIENEVYLHRKKFAISRIFSSLIIISIPILLSTYSIPIVITSLITVICGIQITLDLKHQPHRRLEL